MNTFHYLCQSLFLFLHRLPLLSSFGHTQTYTRSLFLQHTHTHTYTPKNEPLKGRINDRFFLLNHNRRILFPYHSFHNRIQLCRHCRYHSPMSLPRCVPDVVADFVARSDRPCCDLKVFRLTTKRSLSVFAFYKPAHTVSQHTTHQADSNRLLIFISYFFARFAAFLPHSVVSNSFLLSSERCCGHTHTQAHAHTHRHGQVSYQKGKWAVKPLSSL